MPKSVIELSYCRKCGCNLKLDSTETLCDDCKDDDRTFDKREVEDDGSCCIKDDETELDPDYFDDDDIYNGEYEQ